VEEKVGKGPDQGLEEVIVQVRLGKQLPVVGETLEGEIPDMVQGHVGSGDIEVIYEGIYHHAGDHRSRREKEQPYQFS
jgi:hypothetical protein